MLEFIGKIDRNQFAVIVGMEGVTPTCQAPTHLPVIGDLPVVHDGDVFKTGCPERVRGLGTNRGLGRETHMAVTVGTGDFTDVLDIIDLMRGAVILDDIERMPDRDQLGVILDILGEIEQVAIEIDRYLVGTADRLL